MRGKITKSIVDKLEAGALMWDENLCGFGVRRQLRHPHYVLRYRFQGRQRLVTIGRHGTWTPEAARREAQRLLGVVAGGTDPGATAKVESVRPEQSNLFGAMVERYLDRQRLRLRPRSLIEVERHLRQHAKPLHDLALPDITRRHIASVLATVETGSGMVTRNRVRASLSAMWRWLITEGHLENNPVAGTAKANEGRGRDRVLSAAEIKAVWSAAGDDDFGRVVKLLLLTGCRRNEIGLLQWSEINLVDAVIILPANRCKNHREHTLPLSRQALALLPLFDDRAGSVFQHGEQWSYDTSKLIRRAGVSHFTLHDLRRSFVTWMNELGLAPPHVVEACVNHISSGAKAGVAGRYNSARYADEMRKALQIWADHIDQITA